MQIPPKRQTGSNADLKKQSGRTEEYLEQLRKDCDQLKKELKESKRTTGESRKENSNLNSMFSELNAELELVRNQLATTNTERSTIEGKLNYTLTQLEQATKQLDAARQENIEHIAKVATLESDITRVNHELEEARKVIATLHDKYTAAAKTANQTSSDSAKQIQELTAELRNERDCRKLDKENAASSILQLETNLANLKRQRDKDAEIARQKSEALDKYYKELAEEAKRTLQAEFDAEKETLEAIATRTLTKEKERAKTEAEKAAALFQKQREQLEADLSRAKEQCAELRALLDSQGSQTSEIREQIEFYQRREAELEDRLAEMDAQLVTAAQNQASSNKQLAAEQEKRAQEAIVAQARLEQKVREAHHAERAKWEAELGRQLELLRRDLSERLNKERNDQISELTKRKTAEMAAAKKAWQEALDKTAQQIAKSKSELESQKRASEDEINALRSKMNAVAGSQEQQVTLLKLEFEKEKALIKAQMSEENRALEERLTSEKRAELDTLDERYRNESMKMMESQRISITALKSKLEQNQERQIKQLDQEHQDALELLQMRLEENHQVELDEETKRHEQEILEVEAQLVDERMRLKQVETNLDDEIDRLNVRIADQAANMAKIEQSQADAEAQVALYKSKLKSQSASFETILSEKQSEINSAREVFEAEKERCINEVEADGLRKQQHMLTEFNQAQELLKGKITDVVRERDELEEKYRNRESREEDIEKIKHIGFMLTEKERQMAKLEEDMRYYQLELVNREQNYNAMFNSSPQVGLLNPLQAAKDATGSASSMTTKKTKSQPIVNPQQRQARFADTFVKIEPSLYVDQHVVPNNRLEPIQQKRTVR